MSSTSTGAARRTCSLKALVARLDADGDAERASTRSFRLDDRGDDTIAYSQKAMRDGKLELK